jgi:hypothetical protein
MKKQDQLILLNRLHRAMKGYNGFDHTDSFGTYRLTATGRLEYVSPLGHVNEIHQDLPTQIHVLINRMEQRNRTGA